MKRRWFVSVDVEAEDADEAVERFLHRLSCDEAEEFVDIVPSEFDDIEWGEGVKVEITRSCG